MISSKKITLITVILTAAVLLGTVMLVLFKDSLIHESVGGEIKLDETHTITVSESDYYTSYTENGTVKITLSGKEVKSGSKKAIFSDGVLTITGGGTYVLSGTLENGSIVVDSAEDTPVRLILNGITVNSDDYAALAVFNSEKTILSLVPGTENTFTDGESYTAYTDADDMPDAAIYSKDDLVINGTGKLIVNGKSYDGIKSNDTLVITESTLVVNAADEGINVNDSIYTDKAEITVVSGSDSIKCENTDSEVGIISLNSGKVTLKSSGDGIYCSGAVYIKDVAANITAGAGSADVQLSDGGFGGGFGRGGNVQNTISDAPSTKGIKAGSILSISGGEYVIDSYDDCIHSDKSIVIDGGKYSVSTGNDAVHAETTLELSPVLFDITKCLEGLEGAYITVYDGEFNIVSADDAINAVGYNSNGGRFPMMGASDSPILEEDIYLDIRGGNINVSTSGDGVDSNGSARISGGNIRIYGPENGGNGSLDFQNGLLINGGTLIAAGNSGMAELPHMDSEQISLSFYLSGNYDSGSLIEICNPDGDVLLSGTSSKRFNWVCVSCDAFETSVEYTLIINGEATETLTVSDNVTSNASNRRR